jgi:hypothetical protein
MVLVKETVVRLSSVVFPRPRRRSSRSRVLERKKYPKTKKPTITGAFGRTMDEFHELIHHPRFPVLRAHAPQRADHHRGVARDATLDGSVGSHREKL